MSSSTGMWGGRFEGETDPLFREFNDSLPFDCALIKQDIRGSIVWAEAICDVGVLSDVECKQIHDGLHEIEKAVDAVKNIFVDATDEDIHGWVERELIERIGDLGKKLHTGRSRNDQVATDFRLWTREAIEQRIKELRNLQKTLVDLAEREKDTILPGYTHLQRAQPILFAHWCLAYFEMLDRDVSRFQDTSKRANLCPLGSAALAGSSFPVDRDTIAKKLGFDGPTANSLDAVSDRDFVLDALNAAATCSLHLSRMAEDIICYNSAEFGFIEMSDAVTSGSSLMPQKKNPDAMELIRGKTGSIFGSLTSLMMTIKGTTLAYNKDFQEDKKPLFNAMHELSMCLRMAARVLVDLKTRPEVCKKAAAEGHANATAFADALVAKGTPFREAHEQAGRVVRFALERGVSIEELFIDDLRSIAPNVDESVYEKITLDAVISSFNVKGGTSPKRIEEAITKARSQLK